MRFKGCILGVCLVFSGNGAAISAPSTPQIKVHSWVSCYPSVFWVCHKTWIR